MTICFKVSVVFFLVVTTKLKPIKKRNLIRLHSTYTETVKKKRARAHTDLIVKATNNFACDPQDPTQRGIKMVSLESTDFLWIC